MRKKTPAKRLRLNREEKEKLVYAAAEAFIKDPSGGIWGAIARALDTLPEDRRPGLPQAKTWGWLLPNTQAIIGQMKRQQEKEPEPPDLTVVTTEQLLQELADRFISEAVDKLKDTVHAGIRTELENIVNQPPRPRVTKPKIAIIGLLKRQEQLIQREFSNEYDLRFWKPSKSSNGSVVEICKQSDHVIGMLGFISHSHEAAIRGVARSYIRVPGGMTALRDKLTELYVN